jgi:hypothetical protein
MDDPKDGTERSTGAGNRRPFERPSITWEESMDVRPTLMAACAKIGGVGNLSCDASPAS